METCHGACLLPKAASGETCSLQPTAWPELDSPGEHSRAGSILEPEKVQLIIFPTHQQLSPTEIRACNYGL